MYSLGTRRPCPICKSPNGIKHCKSPYCKWLSCYRCSTETILVYDDKYRFFVRSN